MENEQPQQPTFKYVFNNEKHAPRGSSEFFEEEIEATGPAAACEALSRRRREALERAGDPVQIALIRHPFECVNTYSYTFNNEHEHERGTNDFREIEVKATSLEAARQHAADEARGLHCVKFDPASPEAERRREWEERARTDAERLAEYTRLRQEAAKQAEELLEGVDDAVLEALRDRLGDRLGIGPAGFQSWAGPQDWAGAPVRSGLPVNGGPGIRRDRDVPQDPAGFYANPRETFQLGDGPAARVASYQEAILHEEINRLRAREEQRTKQREEKKNVFLNAVCGAFYFLGDVVGTVSQLREEFQGGDGLGAVPGFLQEVARQQGGVSQQSVFSTLSPGSGAAAGGFSTLSPGGFAAETAAELFPKTPPAETLGQSKPEAQANQVMPNEPF